MKMMRKRLKVADIYCGAGGLSAGFESAAVELNDKDPSFGFQIVYGVDKNEDAIRTFRNYHFPALPQDRRQTLAPVADIGDITAASICSAIQPHKNVDVLIGGPNCQGVSPAGLRNPADYRNKMLLAFIQLVRDLKPKWFVMENVPGLTHANNYELLEMIFQAFEEPLDDGERYVVQGDVLLAADFGVPQLRYRLFIIGNRIGAPIRFPIPDYRPPYFPSDTELFDYDKIDSRPTYMTVGQAIGDLFDKPVAIGDLQQEEASNLDNHQCAVTDEINIKRIATIPPGGDWRDMPIELLPERFFATRASDQKGAYGRLLEDWPAYTITNGAYNATAGPFTHPRENRTLSVREAARLQSFEDRHIFFGPVISQYRQVGNAVPPRMAQAIAKAVLVCHFRRREARHWGREGRLSLDLIREARATTSFSLPALTPRIVHPAHDQRRSRSQPIAPRSNNGNAVIENIWDSQPRPKNPYPDLLVTLRELARQPGYYRAAKRAKAILGFVEGEQRDQIIAEANVSEASVRKWINGYYAIGLDGWRAYHTSLERISNYQAKLTRKLELAVNRVRKIDAGLAQNGSKPEGPKRLYMNKYLLRLKQKFGDRSVNQLADKIGQVLGYGVGTVYVGDLLAIFDILVEDT